MRNAYRILSKKPERTRLGHVSAEETIELKLSLKGE
jgi:hypothetical protein